MKLNIRKGEYGYYTRLKNMQNDEEISIYMNVQFAKCLEPSPTALQIDVKEGFPSCYKSQDGIKVKFIVLEYEILNVYKDNNHLEESADTTETQTNESVDLDIKLDLNNELPF